MSKGEMNWIVIMMVLSLIVLALLTALSMGAFRSTSENTGCESYPMGRCIPLANAKIDCSNGRTIFTSDCSRASGQACCVELLK